MISMKQFYGIAGGLMVIVFLANCWNFAVSWNNMNIPGRIAFFFGSILFNILLSILFIGLYKITPSQVIDDSKLDEVLKKYEGKK